MNSDTAGKIVNAEQVKSLWIDAELHRQLKMRAAETKKSIREVVEAAVRLYLDGKYLAGK